MEPLLTAAVREHAGDIDYRNARARYPESMRQIVNRDFATTNYRQAVDEAGKKIAWPEPVSCALTQGAEPNYRFSQKKPPRGDGFFYCSGRLPCILTAINDKAAVFHSNIAMLPE